MANILVIDDELGIRALLTEILSDEGHSVEVAENAAKARIARQNYQPDLVLLDIWMPDVDGVTLLKEWGTTGLLTMPVVMMSGHATIDTAVEATKFGACAFLEKPITLERLLSTINTSLKKPEQISVPYPLGTSHNNHQVPYSTPPVAAKYLIEKSASPTFIASAEAQAADGSNPASVLNLDSNHDGSKQIFDLTAPLRDARDAFEKSYFEFHLNRENGSMTRVAERTGLERTHLYRKLKQLGIEMGRGRRVG